MHFVTTIKNLLEAEPNGLRHSQILAKFTLAQETDVERALHELAQVNRIIKIGLGIHRWYFSATYRGSKEMNAVLRKHDVYPLTKSPGRPTAEPVSKRGRPPKPPVKPPEEKIEPMSETELATKTEEKMDIPVFLKPNLANTLTPFEIDIVMHYVLTTGDHKVIENPPPIWSETRSRLFALGLLEQDDGENEQNYRATPKAAVYVREGLCKVPMPVQAWVMPPNVKVAA